MAVGARCVRARAVGNRRQRRGRVVHQRFRVDRQTFILDVGDETADRVRVVGHNLNATVGQGHPTQTKGKGLTYSDALTKKKILICKEIQMGAVAR
jgi:hypothetical protein